MDDGESAKSDAKGGRGLSTACFTCRGGGSIMRHVASALGTTTVTTVCPQCHGDGWLTGLQVPM